MSLADALAVSGCAANVVLLGDPSQLAQVSQGRQPLHAGDSVLQHLLGDAQTVPPTAASFSISPTACSPTFARSSPIRVTTIVAPGASHARARVVRDGRTFAGLYFVSIDHAGNSASRRRRPARSCADRNPAPARPVIDSQPPEQAGVARAMTDRDIIVVTPYNAQRRLILRKLREAGIGVQAGTVDKFQGQEAGVVFYSMATSSGEDLPRDVAFLFERNRFNVAISRARAVSVLLCSPRLLEIPCSTPEQMALANLLCAFAERAQQHVPFCQKRASMAEARGPAAGAAKQSG